MNRLITGKLTRDSLGQVLGLSTLFAILGALLLESLGIKSAELSPVSFVFFVMSTISFVFIMWPVIKTNAISTENGKYSLFLDKFNFFAKKFLGLPVESSGDGARKKANNQPSHMALSSLSLSFERRRQNIRSEQDPRLNAALFSANVPTFILDPDQRFIDWNPAFSLAFGDIPKLKRGSHVSRWYKVLENFKKVSRRANLLQGEAILPITDRERVSFSSKDWGRMVFIKIMTPILDRKQGKIIGWTVVLNINSVNKRLEFFEALYQIVSQETKKRFYAACYDGIFSRDSIRHNLVTAHSANLGNAKNILDLGAFTGELTLRLAREGRRVTTVEGDLHLLRRIADKSHAFGSAIRIVKQPITELKHLPTDRFDGVTMLLTANRLLNLQGTLEQIISSMKEGAILTMSAIVDPYQIDTVFNAMRQELTEKGDFDALKDQFNHVLEYERQQAEKLPYQYRSLIELCHISEQVGFIVEKIIKIRIGQEHLEACALLVLRKERS